MSASSSSASARLYACVTGAGSGIGRAITLHLARQGVIVFAVGRRINKLEETRALLGKNEKGSIQVVSEDVTLVEGRANIFKTVAKQTKSLQYLVHNAGVVGPLVPLEKIPLAGFQNTMTTNVEAPVFLTQTLLPLLSAAKSNEGGTNKAARILHISSGCAHSPSVSWLSYCVSKAAFLMAYKCMALEFKTNNIGVLCGSVKPGIVDSEMQDEMRQSSETDFPKVKRFKELREGLEKKRHNDVSTHHDQPHFPDRDALDTPENVAHFVWFLLQRTSDEEYDAIDWDIRDEGLKERWIMRKSSSSLSSAS